MKGKPMTWLYLISPKTGHRVSVQERDYDKKIAGSDDSYKSLGYEIEYTREDASDGHDTPDLGTHDDPGDIDPPPTDDEVKQAAKDRKAGNKPKE